MILILSFFLSWPAHASDVSTDEHTAAAMKRAKDHVDTGTTHDDEPALNADADSDSNTKTEAQPTAGKELSAPLKEEKTVPQGLQHVIVHEEPAPGTAALKAEGAKATPSEDTVMEPKATPSGEASPTATDGEQSAKAEPKAAASTSAETAAAKSPAHADVSAETSLKWLGNGNIRFVKKHFRADGRLPKDRAKVANGAAPHAIILSCSDSRVPPELIFDQGLGEIDTIRVAGEALDGAVIASIEDALKRTHPHLLVVLGHTRCDTVADAVKLKEGESAGSEFLDQVLASVRARLNSIKDKQHNPDLEAESAVNADGIARELVTKSELIRKLVESKDLTIRTGLYWVDTGKVKFY